MTEDDLFPPAEAGQATWHAVYRCYSDRGQLLYVGTSRQFGRRFARHAQTDWFTQVRGITFEWYADELDALNAERRAIYVEHPKYNVQHRDVKKLKVPSRPPRPRFPRPDKVVDTIRDHPDWNNALVASHCDVHVRTVQRRRRELKEDAA